MMVTDNDLERLREICFKLGAYELAADSHGDVPIKFVKETIEKAWNITLGEQPNE